MADLFIGEYGKTIYVETGFDLSSATNVTLRTSGPTGGIFFTNSASVSVLASNVTTSACGVFSANKTVEYVVNQGDFSASTSSGAAEGTWKCWLEVDFGTTKRLISSSFKFEVVKPG
jgi:hypothetical protein